VPVGAVALDACDQEKMPHMAAHGIEQSVQIAIRRAVAQHRPVVKPRGQTPPAGTRRPCDRFVSERACDFMLNPTMQQPPCRGGRFHTAGRCQVAQPFEAVRVTVPQGRRLYLLPRGPADGSGDARKRIPPRHDGASFVRVAGPGIAGPVAFLRDGRRRWDTPTGQRPIQAQHARNLGASVAKLLSDRMWMCGDRFHVGRPILFLF